MTRYIASPAAVFAAVPGGGVVLHTGTKRYFSLNETGARIWALVESTGDAGATADALAGEYDIAAAEAAAAVEDLLARLVDAGLLERRNAGGVTT